MTVKNTSSFVIIAISTLLGLWFGYALNMFVGALIVGAISLVGSYIALSRYEATAAKVPTDASAGPSGEATHVEDPALATFLFKDTRSAALWLPVRIFIGWEWLDAGWGKFNNPKWIETGESLKGYWTNAVRIPEEGRPPITFEWWRGFIQFLLDTESHTWFSKLIIFGEILVGLGLIVGALVGIAAFFGALMNFSFLLSGSASTNPVMLLIAFLLILAWKTAGWMGLDRFLLPVLGTPWQRGALLQRRVTPQPMRS